MTEIKCEGCKRIIEVSNNSIMVVCGSCGWTTDIHIELIQMKGGKNIK